MLLKNKFSRMRQSLALFAAVLLSGCLQPLTINVLAKPSTAKSRRLASPKNSAQSRATKPLYTPENKYGEKGPMVRVALLTDVTSVALSSTSELTLRRFANDKQILAGGQILAEVRQPSAIAATPNSNPDSYSVPNAGSYRVEVAASEDSLQAKKITENVKKKYDQTTSTVYNEQTGQYRVLTGKYSSRTQASDMVAILREAGYANARLIANPTPSVTGKATPVTTGKKTTASAPKKNTTRPTAYKAKPSPREAIAAVNPTPRSATHLAAFEADKLLASSERLLIISPLRRGEEVAKKPASPQPANSGALKTDAMKADAKKASLSTPARSETVKAASQVASIKVDDRDYRGEIHLALNERGRLNVINVLPLEEYLRGVVPMELSPSSAQMEALKAQAVAARSYALSSLGRFKDEGFDLRDDQRSQVYGGLTAEHGLSNRAVEETRGVVALNFNEYGKAYAIEALYTSDCGGRTENNENIFANRAIPYLRSVDCPLDNDLPTGREILSSAKIESITEPFGHSLARDLALLNVVGFTLPNKVDNDYLRGSVDKNELQAWAETASKLLRKAAAKAQPARYDTAAARDREAGSDSESFDINHEIALLKSQKRDITRLPGFAALMSLAAYGESRASMFMTASEVNYVLAGLGAEEVPKEARADLAMLIKSGILRLPGDGQIDAKASVKRGHALETFSRAIALKARSADLNLQTGFALEASKNQILINPSNQDGGSRNPSLNGRAPRQSDADSGYRPRRNSEPQQLAVEKEARLFRVLGDDSYAVDRLGIRGNERITYHLNSAGRIDFLEVEVSDRDESHDHIADASKWSAQVSAEELQRRLAKARIDVGEIKDITPLAFGASRRVVELEIVGTERTAQLRGGQIRNALGLKDNPMVIERERDSRGNATQISFTGKGFGHGVGMCQVGAMRLAKQGQSYIGIVQKYYTGVSVQKIY
jgi:peptidoglycan hydrolase-like amidase